MSVHRLPTTLRDRVAARVRDDVIHDSPLSQCNASVDECPDWPLAYVITDLILPTIADSVEGLRAAVLQTDPALDRLALERWNAALDDVLALLAER